MSAQGGDDDADEIVGRCRERLERGEVLDVEAVVREHPAFAQVLHARLSVMVLLHARSNPAAAAGARAPLRRVDPQRYVQFAAAGEGGMGVVYSAVDTELQRVVAFKMIRPDTAEDRPADAPATPLDLVPERTGSITSSTFEERKARFLQEAWITGGLEHPGVVPIYEMGETPGGIPYYTMRFVRGLRTLAEAIGEVRDRPIEDRLALVEPFLRLCDTVAYAHSMNVVHRDLKPANVALGNYGEVVLLDWGLAKLAGHEDSTASRWEARVREYRSATDLRTVASALGTPGYMSPEAASGRLEEVDARSDVYSLGTILFEILTGRLPFEFSTYVEFLAKVSRDEASRPRTIDPSIPQALDDLVARCLSRRREARPKDVESIARTIRTWVSASALEREIAGHLRDAGSALEAADSATGADRLRHADRAAAAIEQVTARDPARAEAMSLTATLASLRNRGLEERDRSSRRRVLVRGGIGVLVAAAVTAVLVARAIDGKRKDADAARAEAVVARGAAERAHEKTQAALDELLRLSDSKRVRDLIAEADRLWPAWSSKVPAMADWLKRAGALIRNRPAHVASLERVRSRALPHDDATWRANREAARARLNALGPQLDALYAERLRLIAADPDTKRPGVEKAIDAGNLERQLARMEFDKPLSVHFQASEDEWHHQVLVDVLAALDRLQDPENPGQGLFAEMQRRHELAATLEERSLGIYEAEWRATVAGIRKSPKYHGLSIPAQLGLVPLGADPDSGLFEFAHLGSGPIPVRDPATKRLQLPDAGFSIVLVLIPGGMFHAGAQRTDSGGRKFFPQASEDEGPVRLVTLSPHFLSKFECTQAQWATMTSGAMPSCYQPDAEAGGRVMTLRHPVETISWDDCATWLPRFGLRLPTEAEWEYGCAAATQTPWSTGTTPPSLQGAANVADAFCRSHGGPAGWDYDLTLDDGFTLHAPVGSLAPNAWGLHDLHGNVWEWCFDGYGRWTSDPVTDPRPRAKKAPEGFVQRVYRGGGFYAGTGACRTSVRAAQASVFRDRALGVRPARVIIPD